jgi:thiol-disulfide isomerase/thioredoxin
MGLLALCLVLGGCSTLGKKNAAPKSAADERSAQTGRRDPPPPSPPSAVSSSEVNAIVTGRVVDYFYRTPPADVWIITLADEYGPPIAQHQETLNGYFRFDHLRPGQSYRLVALTREGDSRQGAETTVRAPAVQGLILQVSHDHIPTIPGGGDNGPRPTIGQPVPIAPSGSPYSDQGPAAVIGQPVPLPPPGQTTPIQPEHFAGQDSSANRESPRVTIPNPWGPRTAPPPPPPPPAPRSAPSGGLVPMSGPPLAPTAAMPVVSCRLNGNQLDDFTLAGLDGQMWGYKRNRLPGTRLVLLDFWGSWCPPCRAAIKQHLNELHDTYGRLGLEIIGIAYERGDTYAEHVQAVQTAVRNLDIRYRILMGYGENCPVRRDFGVKAFPTLVLINDRGQIIWRNDGSPTAAEVEYLKVEIRKELGIR